MRYHCTTFENKWYCAPSVEGKMRNSPQYFVNFIYGIKKCHGKDLK